ncbi:MAG: EAL domain-containing protein [Deltaproteobacteria bacterium]|nr:EAL domain-containing protein [Deltaproteobacteria bacterium]
MRPITRLNLLAILATSSFLAISLSYVLIFLPMRNYENQLQEYHDEQLSARKEQITQEVRNRIKALHDKRRDLPRQATRMLKYRAGVIAGFIDLQFRQGLRAEEILSSLNAMARLTPWAKENSEYFILNRETRFLAHSRHPELLGQDLRSCMASNPLIKNAVEQILNCDGLHECRLPCLDCRQPHQSERLAVVCRVEAADWFVVTYKNVDILERELQLQTLRELAEKRFGEMNSGYFFVLDREGRPLMRGILDQPFNSDLSPLPIKPGREKIARQLTDCAASGKGICFYRHPNPNKADVWEDKVAYVELFPPWQWTIGTGLYISELEQSFAAQKQKLKNTTWHNARLGLLLLGLNLLFSLAIFLLTKRHINRLENNSRHHLRELEQYKTILDLSCLVSKGDLKGNITYANQALLKVSGYSWEEINGRPHNIFRHPSVPKAVFKNLWETIEQGKVWRGAGKNRGKDGSAYITDIVIAPLRDERGRIVEYLAARHDITELLENREKLQLAFATDNLTSLGSRYKLLQNIADKTGNLELMLFDINGFRDLNHDLGNAAADQILKWVADQLVNVFHEKYYQHYRLQADTFAVLSDPPDPDKNLERSYHFLDFFTKHPCQTAASATIYLSFCCGLATADKNLLCCADIALKKAKKSNTALVRYSIELDNEHLSRSYWLNEVIQAMRGNRLVPYYQPIVDLRSGAVLKYEALMRLLDEKGGAVPPHEFLPIMKQTHHYAYMTMTIIEQACACFQRRRDAVSINLSVDDLLRPETVETLLDTAKQTGVIERLTIEIVETENIQNYENAMQALDLLRQEGITIAIDDFGSGYANFTYLTEMRADYIKLDGSLVKQVNNSPQIRELLASIINFAHQSRMLVIAEFVSSQEILKAMLELGADYGQGYLFSPALPENQLVDQQRYDLEP